VNRLGRYNLSSGEMECIAFCISSRNPGEVWCEEREEVLVEIRRGEWLRCPDEGQMPLNVDLFLAPT